MRLPGTIEERLRVIHPELWLLPETDAAELEDEDVRVTCSLAGAPSCILLRLDRRKWEFLRKERCADFALLLARGSDTFEAHIVELKRSVGERAWADIQEQLEWAAVRLLAVAGVLGIRIHGVVTYTAFVNDKVAREGSTNPAVMKIPIGPSGIGANDPKIHRWAEARRSWERGLIRLKVFGCDVEHRRIRANEVGPTTAGHTAVACRPRSSPREDDTRWLFEPILG